MDFDDIGIMNFSIFKATKMILPLCENGVLSAEGEAVVKTFADFGDVVCFSVLEDLFGSVEVDPGDFGASYGGSGLIYGIQ